MSWLWRSGGQPKGVSRSSVEESHEQLDVTDRGRPSLPVHLGEMEAKEDRKGASRQSWQQGDAGGSLSSYLVKATSPKSKGKTKATTMSSVEAVDKDVKTRRRAKTHGGDLTDISKQDIFFSTRSSTLEVEREEVHSTWTATRKQTEIKRPQQAKNPFRGQGPPPVPLLCPPLSWHKSWDEERRKEMKSQLSQLRLRQRLLLKQVRRTGLPTRWDPKVKIKSFQTQDYFWMSKGCRRPFKENQPANMLSDDPKH